ncbi:hypothetical protein V1507DRAFT_191498 [Lipomyces tetrasporus]
MLKMYSNNIGNGMYAATAEQLYAYNSYLMASSISAGIENQVSYLENNVPYGYYQYAVPYQMYMPQANGLPAVEHNTSDASGDSAKHTETSNGIQHNKGQQTTAESSHSVQLKNLQKSPTFSAMAFPQSFPDSPAGSKPYNYDGQVYYPPLAYQMPAYPGQGGSYPYPALSYGENYSRENYFDPNVFSVQGASAFPPMANSNRGYSGQYTNGKHQGARGRAHSSAQRTGMDKSG